LRKLKIDTKLRAWRWHKPQSPWSSSCQESPNPAPDCLAIGQLKPRKCVVFDDVGIAPRPLRWI
jgi:hypothetical protein